MIKTISIEEKHQKMIEENHINLSRFVQSKLEEEYNNKKNKNQL